MRLLRALFRADNGAAAAEMAMVFPFMLVLMFGAVELGNLFLDEHTLTKQVRDGARYASRLPLSKDFVCDSEVFDGDDDDVKDDIKTVTKDGSLSGDDQARWTSYWDRNCDGEAESVAVDVRCVD